MREHDLWLFFMHAALGSGLDAVEAGLVADAGVVEFLKRFPFGIVE